MERRIATPQPCPDAGRGARRCRHADPADEVLGALADPTRARSSSDRGEQTVRVLTGLCRRFAARGIEAPGHPRVAGPVHDRHAGRQAHCSAQPQGLVPLIDWIGHDAAIRADRFNRPKALLSRMDQ